MNLIPTNALTLIVPAILAGCSTADDGAASMLRWNASIRSVVHRSAIPSGTDLRCAPPLGRPVDGLEPLVAIVRLRVGRAPYDMAFWLPDGLDAQPGASVTVDSRRCKLSPAPTKN